MADEAGTPASDWRATFEATYSSPASPTQERVWRDVFGDEYPVGVDPYSYVSRSELARISHDVGVGPGEALVDVGCGRGGAGLWVASATGARLIGVDIADAAVEAARARSRAMRIDATFLRGEFESTTLADGAADGVMSVDALLFTPDKAAAFRELHRILAPGRRLVLTSWDYHRQPAGRPPQVPDHRPLAEAAGFRVLAYDETADWRERLLGTGAGLLARVDALAAESGESIDEVRTGILEMNATYETMSRRFLLVAEARPAPSPGRAMP